MILFKKNRLCSTHPHNYYLEILTETGIIGFSLSIVFAAIFLAYLFKNFKSFKGKSFEEYILLSAAISLFMELFPLKSLKFFKIKTINNNAIINVIKRPTIPVSVKISK